MRDFIESIQAADFLLTCSFLGSSIRLSPDFDLIL